MYNFIKTTDDGVTKYLTDAEADHTSSTHRRLKSISEMSREMKSLNLVPGDRQDFERYLSLEDNHESARVTGKLAEKLRLKYSPDIFVKMTNGLYEDGRSVLRKSDKKQMGYSGALSMSKSISMLYAVSDRHTQKLIRDAVNKADSQVTEEMQKRLKPSNKKAKYKHFDPSKTKAVFFEFWHYEARTVSANGDRLEPHLHKHKQLMNFAEFAMEDGSTKMMAIDAAEMLKATKELTAKFNTLLATELHKIGIQTEECSEPGLEHSIRVKGISREMELNLSSRHKEIEGLIGKYADQDKYFSSTKQLEEELSRKSRNEKKITSADEIHSLINQNTLNVIDKSELQKSQQHKSNFSRSPFEALSKIEAHPDFDLKGEMSLPNVKAAITNSLRFSKCYESLEELDKDVDHVLAKMEMDFKLVRKENGSYTTLKVIENEVEAIKNSSELAAKFTKHLDHKPDEFRAIVDRYCKTVKQQTGIAFNEGQTNAMTLVAQRRGITYIEGDAGTGKTTSVIKFANETYSNKSKVIGLATQTKTASSLVEAGIEQRFSIAEFLSKVQSKTNGDFDPIALWRHKGSCLIIDEAGMVGAEHYRKITEFCLKTDSHLILVGDVKQLASVQHGDTLRAIERSLDHSFKARLWQNMRQKNTVAQEVAESFRDGKTERAVEILEKNGLLQSTAKKSDLYAKIAEDYIKDESKSKLVLAYNNSDCDSINDEIRSRLMQSGVISKEAAKNQALIYIERKSGNGSKVEAGRLFAEGDKIVFTENMKISKGQKIKNADVATVKRITKEGESVFFTVEIDSKEVTFDASKHRTFNHAYAVTTYKSQGQTVENAYVFGTGNMTSNSAYVNFSRHKESVKLYIQSEELESFKQNAKQSQVKVSAAEDKLALAAYEARRVLSKSPNKTSPNAMPKVKGMATKALAIVNNKARMEEEKRRRDFNKLKASTEFAEFQSRNPHIICCIENLDVIQRKITEEKRAAEAAKLHESLAQKLKPPQLKPQGPPVQQ